MIGVGTRLRPGRLKLGLRLGVPPVVVPPTYTLDNTEHFNTVSGDLVLEWAAKHAAIRARLIDAGQSVGSDTSRPINVQTAELLAAVEALESAEASVPALTLSGPATISEGNPNAAPALTLSGPATLTEGN